MSKTIISWPQNMRPKDTHTHTHTHTYYCHTQPIACQWEDAASSALQQLAAKSLMGLVKIGPGFKLGYVIRSHHNHRSHHSATRSGKDKHRDGIVRSPVFPPRSVLCSYTHACVHKFTRVYVNGVHMPVSVRNQVENGPLRDLAN